MNKYDYEKIDWSKCPSIEKYADIGSINEYVMNIELSEEKCNKTSSEKENISKKYYHISI